MRNAVEQQAGELMTIPLSLLVPSPRNVRKTGGVNVDELAASIKAQGLMQNLLVIEQESKRGKPTGKYEVVAGGRRLRLLEKAGDVSPEEEILCKLTSKVSAPTEF